MRLTKRDVQILLKINECQWLSTSQIKRYFFAGTTDRCVNKRLKILVQDGYIFCDRISLVDEYYFRLAGKGKSVLDEYTNLDYADIIIPRKLPIQLHHFSVLNDLRWYLEGSLLRVSGRLNFFYVDRELRGLLSGSQIIPDILTKFTMTIGGDTKSYVVAIEYDSGSENPQYFGRDKIRKYYEALHSGYELFNSQNFRVLVVANNRRRILQLIRSSVKFLNLHIMILYGALEDLERNNDLFSEIFIDPQQSRGREIWCSLLE